MCRGFVIALGHLHPSHAVPGLRRIAVLVENLPVGRTGGVPVGDRGQTFGKPQLRGWIVRPDPQRGPKRLDGGFKCALRLLHGAEQIEPIEILRLEKARSRVDLCRGVVLLIRVKGHRQAADCFGVARVRDGCLFRLIDLRANGGKETGSIQPRQLRLRPGVQREAK